uniref:Uncharacterized protein n=1 Tax=Avena sativa TaxID=4498 RepID=A0ACD5U513_AVESA
MGSGARARARATACLPVAPPLLLLIFLVRGAEAIGLWRPPPEAGSGLLGAAPGRYLTQEEHWMSQTLDHFSPTLENDGDFLYLLADAAAIAFQYGNPDALCSPLVEAKKNGTDLVEAFAHYVNKYYVGTFGASVASYDQQYLKNTTPAESSYRLWWYQVCSEVSYFQVAPKNDSVRSAKLDTRYHLDLCRNVFGEGVYPDVSMTNLYYGGTRIAGMPFD